MQLSWQNACLTVQSSKSDPSLCMQTGGSEGQGAGVQGRWAEGMSHLLRVLAALQKTHTTVPTSQFPVPTSQLTTVQTPVPGCTMIHRQTCVQNTHTHKINASKRFKVREKMEHSLLVTYYFEYLD